MSEFVDPETYRGGGDEGGSFQYCIIEQIRRIMRLQSREMRGGYFTERTVMKGGIATSEKIYVPDAREEYCNAVEAMHDALIPYFLDDKKLNDELTLIQQELNDLKQDTLDKTDAEDRVILPSERYSDKDKIVVEEYRFLKYEITRRKYRVIQKMLKTLGYMSGDFGIVDDISGYE